MFSKETSEGAVLCVFLFSAMPHSKTCSTVYDPRIIHFNSEYLLFHEENFVGFCLHIFWV